MGWSRPSPALSSKPVATAAAAAAAVLRAAGSGTGPAPNGIARRGCREPSNADHHEQQTHLEASGAGRLVNISSIGGRIAVPHLAAYCASKFALTGLSESLRAELAERGVAVTTVTPGLMRTGSFFHALFKGRRRGELDWFGVSSSLPLLTMNADRAARKILDACRHGRATLTLTPQARAAEIANRLFPSLAAKVTEQVAALLPAPPDDGSGEEAVPGHRLRSQWVPSALTRLGERAARRHRELAAAGDRGSGVPKPVPTGPSS